MMSEEVSEQGGGVFFTLKQIGEKAREKKCGVYDSHMIELIGKHCVKCCEYMMWVVNC